MKDYRKYNKLNYYDLLEEYNRLIEAYNEYVKELNHQLRYIQLLIDHKIIK